MNFRSNKTNIFTLFCLLLGLSSSAYGKVTDVTAQVDRNPVMVDESFVLEVVANDNVSIDAFDSSPLMKDFVVGRTSSSRQTQMVNFETTRTTRWSTVLIPRQPGTYKIPAFNIEGVSSRPINLQVLPVSQSKSTQSQDVFLDIETDLEEVYLQQQVRYTVKLFIALDLQRGSLSAPTMEDAEIEQVGQDKEYSEIVNGKRYRVIERTFSIIPQKSGQLTVQGPYFEGEILDNSRSSFGFFNRTKTVNKVGKNLFIRVRPIPTNYQHHWLPSEHVEIHNEWQGIEQNQLTVGEPVTRTITLTALGVVEAQLPEINSQYPNTVKTYPDQAETTTVERNGTFVSQRTENIAIIPSEAGTLTLPEVQVPWFNVVTGKTEYAVLPKQTFTVVESLENNNAPIISPATNPSNQTTTAPTITQPALSTSNHWWSISSWVLLAIWLITLIAWFISAKFSSHKDNQNGNSVDAQAMQEKQLWLKVQASLKQQDAQTLTNNLQPWLAYLCGNPQQSLTKSIEQLGNSELSQQLDTLFASRYGSSAATMSKNEPNNIFKALSSTLKTIRDNEIKKPSPKGAVLLPMYPHKVVQR